MLRCDKGAPAQEPFADLATMAGVEIEPGAPKGEVGKARKIEASRTPLQGPHVW
jgi:hypothetical protein